jgi:hypothetical protein
MIRKIILHILFIGSFAFLMNFFWESLHAVYLYRDHDISSAAYVPMLLAMSFKDSLIILGLFFFIAFLKRSIDWLESGLGAPLAGFILLSVLTAAAIEWFSVAVFSRWNYLETMPTVFGVGLSPLLQLAITGLLTVWLSKKILYDQGLIKNLR